MLRGKSCEEDSEKHCANMQRENCNEKKCLTSGEISTKEILDIFKPCQDLPRRETDRNFHDTTDK